MATDPVTANLMSLVEVGELCADVAASSERLFRLAAASMASCDGGTRQRRFAAASDRHAWHRDLAFSRSPRIPLVPPIEATLTEAEETRPPTDAAWRREAESLRDRLLASYHRLDPELDPATARLVQLVVSDLDELGHELSDPTP